MLKITLSGKEVEVFINDNQPEGDDFALYNLRGDEIGKISISNISRRASVVLNGNGKDLFWQGAPVLTKETLQTVLDAQAQAIAAKRGAYVESADEKAEWNDDQYGHIVGRK